MDWSKTKTIFIVVFLILDIFLLILFVQKYNDSQLETIGDLSTTERLAGENVTLGELPDVEDSRPYLNAEYYRFMSSDLQELEGQTATIREGQILESVLTEPVAIEDPENPEELNELLEDYVTNGGQYTFWEYDEEDNQLIYFQTFEGLTLYYNLNAQIAVQLNGNNEAISYEQTYLTSLEEFTEEQQLREPRSVLETFYDRNLIQPNSTAVDLQLGYYPLFVQETGGDTDEGITQVLTPTWKMTIENEDGSRNDLFMNAVDGSIYDMSQVDLDFEQLEEEDEIAE
ncbi:two-component system regulatory protein YycI [Jeotgalibacillus haloalkalitolerans]|uniref:Two-component system regulatory protein YycI n=1 Tax=Jeotgalibacillus haloalkalitolerans TaxID=3104292 RepID=A0ABU5KHK1_9BACL|nr:two-component system regulatory protein YycI [Jeotgalibacillus sp. HH7-29]MDZ5710623.1 two-component system regulatory protein YycI [Jeotgalibacillus sp. HH7-29]